MREARSNGSNRRGPRVGSPMAHVEIMLSLETMLSAPIRLNPEDVERPGPFESRNDDGGTPNDVTSRAD